MKRALICRVFAAMFWPSTAKANGDEAILALLIVASPWWGPHLAMEPADLSWSDVGLLSASYADGHPGCSLVGSDWLGMSGDFAGVVAPEYGWSNGGDVSKYAIRFRMDMKSRFGLQADAHFFDMENPGRQNYRCKYLRLGFRSAVGEC